MAKHTKGMKGPTPDETAEQEKAMEARAKAQRNQEAVGMHSQFFNLRAQLFNTYLTSALATLPDIVKMEVVKEVTQKCHALAHDAAAIDFIARYEQAKELIESLGEVCNPSPVYDLLTKADKLQ